MSSTDKSSFSDKVNQVFVQTLYNNKKYSEAINKVIGPKIKDNDLNERNYNLEKEDDEKTL